MKIFQKKVEDFTCRNCGQDVEGSGYTNHCPNCLWSMHVDINPGDRAEKCGGMMEPVDLEKRGDVFMIVHKCQKCGFKRQNRAEKGDNFQKLIEISNYEPGN